MMISQSSTKPIKCLICIAYSNVISTNRTSISCFSFQQDQFEGVSYHTNKGIDFLDKYGSFVKERCAIEIEYANKLKRLVKNHQYKKKDESDTQ